MRSNLLKSALSVFALAVAAMFVGTLAMAAPTFSGGAGAGFGIASWDTGATATTGTGTSTDKPSDSAYNNQVEANLIASGKTENGAGDYYVRLRVRGTQGDTIPKDFSEGSLVPSVGVQSVNSSKSSAPGSDGNAGSAQTARARVGVNFGDLRIEMGKLPGIGGTGFADQRPVRAPSGFRHPVNNAGVFDSGAINVAYKAGAMKVGLVITTDCQVSCGVTGGAEVTDNSTLMPYFQGAFGGIKVGARLPQSSGKIRTAGSGTAKVGDAAKGSAMDIEASIPAGPVNVSFEFLSFTAKAVDSTLKDNKGTDITIAVNHPSGFLFQYSTSERDSGSTASTYKKPKTTLFNIDYMMDLGGIKFGPEYAAVTQGASSTTGKDQKGTLLRLMAVMGF